MRVSDKMGFDQVKLNLSKNRAELANLQNQAATQKRITKPSDDPIAAARVLSTRTEITGNTQFQKSVNSAKAFLEYSDQSLGEMTEALIRAKELAVSQSSDASANESTRRVVASEVSQLHDQIVQIGNRKLGDRYLFGGYRTTQAPFTSDGQYLGDDGIIEIQVNKDANVGMNIPGSQVFLGKDLQAARLASDKLERQIEAGKAPKLKKQKPEPAEQAEPVSMRSPAGLKGRGEEDIDGVEQNQEPTGKMVNVSSNWLTGSNVFNVLKQFEMALRTNDKGGVQDSLDRIDEAIAQVVLARSDVGSRVGTLQSSSETLQKGQVDAKGLASSLEDADTFEVVSDINRTESTLKATMETSGKLIQPSLLDFLK